MCSEEYCYIYDYRLIQIMAQKTHYFIFFYKVIIAFYTNTDMYIHFI